MTAIQFQPLIPTALWLALAAATAAAVVWYGWRRPAAVSRRRWLAIMMLAGGGTTLLLLILLNPIWLFPVPPPEGKPLVTILADRSASMAVSDQPAGQSRLQAAAALAVQLQRELVGDFDVQVRTFAETTASVLPQQLMTTAADGQLTDLAAAVAESLDGNRIQGQALVVLSDGIHNAPGGAAEVLRVVQTSKAMAVPIFTSTIGGQTAISDLELSLIRQQELAFVGQQTPVRAQVKERGRLVGKSEVVLLDQTGAEIERQSVTLIPDGTATAVFHVSQSTPGLYRYQVRAEPLAREATAANNISTFLLRTVDRPIRVLLLEGKPYWDAKFLMRSLARDAALELDAVVRVSEGRYLQRTFRRAASTAELAAASHDETTEILTSLPAMLSASDQLAVYQVVVLGRDAESFLTEPVLERLRSWISRDGGSLVCFRGAPVAKLNQQLARLMPVSWTPSPETRFRMQLTSRGQDLSWIAAAPGDVDTLGRLPSLATASSPQRPTPLAVVVAQSPGQAQPVLTYQPYGSGRVVAIEGAGMWRWAFLAPAHQETEPVYEALWQGLVRWLVAGSSLAPGQNLALRTDKISFFSEEPVVATLLAREAALSGGVPSVELKRADGAIVGTFTPVPLGEEPGVYRVPFGRLATGAYQAAIVGVPTTASETTTAFDVRPNFTEQLDTAARPDLLARMAEESGGAVLAEVRAAEIAERFQAHLARSRPMQLREITAWDQWWVLVLVVGTWSTAWGLRRARGLV
jgi:hypothetical protein